MNGAEIVIGMVNADPQIFAGCDIDMDQFMAHLGPDNDQRARNIANDPYASAQFFFFIIGAVLECLFQVSTTKYCVHSGKGVLGVEFEMGI
jgi:hypothetical protein